MTDNTQQSLPLGEATIEVDEYIGRARASLARAIQMAREAGNAVPLDNSHDMWLRNALFAAANRMTSELRTLRTLRAWIQEVPEPPWRPPIKKMLPRRNTNDITQIKH